MEILLISLGLIGSIAFLTTIWYLIRWIIGKADHKPIFRKRFFISIIIYIVGIIGVGILGSQQNDEEAVRLGFASTQEYLDAKKQGISDPAAWIAGAAQREMEEKQRIANEQAEIARLKQETDDQAKAETEAKAEQAAIDQAKSEFFKQPDQQLHFIEVIANARNAMKKAANDLAKGGIRRERFKDVCGVLNNGNINRWSGKLTNLTTNGDGLGVITVEIGSRIWLKTWNNSFSDVADGTMIDPETPLFAKLSTLREGDLIVFDAKLIPTSSGPDCYLEGSLTLEGSMRSPEFIARFIDIDTFEEK